MAGTKKPTYEVGDFVEAFGDSIMQQPLLPINRDWPAPHLAHHENVARVVGRVLFGMGEPSIVEPGTREFHQAEALRFAENVRYQFTREAKKQAKRDCLGHLIASLAPEKSGKKAGTV